MARIWQQIVSGLPVARNGRPRRGIMLVLTAVLMIVMFAMLAFSIDLGYIVTVQTELQRSVDAASLAGVGMLVVGQNEAEEKAIEYLVRNPAGKRYDVIEDQLALQIAEFKADHREDFEIEVGHWDPTAFDQDTGSYGKIVPAVGLPSALAVFYAVNDEPLFFGGLLGKDRFSVQARSVAQLQPREIMLVLDLSGSMNDDTEFGAIDSLGRQHVEANLLQCWHDLGSPIYGTLDFAPQYANVPGNPPPAGGWPQLHTEYRRKQVKVTSTLDLSRVKLEFTNGNTQTFSGLSGTTGTFAGTSGNNGKDIAKVWVKSGSNAYSDPSGNGELFDFSSASKIRTLVKKAFGLNNVDYPYPSGSWNEFIDYCRDTSNNANYDAGYYSQYGYMNLINYWLEVQYGSQATPDLWKCSAYPIKAVKDSVGVFMDYIQEVDTSDRVGLSVYNWSSGNGKLEFPLTENLQNIETLTDHFQAGHYHNYTNIGAGMTKAREELVANARPGALKVMVLMTDGQANWVNGGSNTSGARQYVIDEANLAKGAKIAILTISLGSGADTGLMQNVADITNGRHFNVPGGGAVQEYHQGLLGVFREIADDRPLKLVQ